MPTVQKEARRKRKKGRTAVVSRSGGVQRGREVLVQQVEVRAMLARAAVSRMPLKRKTWTEKRWAQSR